AGADAAAAGSAGGVGAGLFATAGLVSGFLSGGLASGVLGSGALGFGFAGLLSAGGVCKPGGVSEICAAALSANIRQPRSIDTGRRTFIPASSLVGLGFSGHCGVTLPDRLARVHQCCGRTARI